MLNVWNLSGLVYSSHSDSLSESRLPDAATESSQVVTSAFYCQALDVICVTTHEHNIIFYQRDGLKQFKQVSLQTLIVLPKLLLFLPEKFNADYIDVSPIAIY